MVTQRSWVWAQLSAVIVPVFKEVIQQNHSEIAGTWAALCLAQESSLSMAAIVRPPVLRDTLSSWKRILLWEIFHFQIILSYNHNNFFSLLIKLWLLKVVNFIKIPLSCSLCMEYLIILQINVNASGIILSADIILYRIIF